MRNLQFGFYRRPCKSTIRYTYELTGTVERLHAKSLFRKIGLRIIHNQF